jgi:glycosyltransferase involved in cell wall biosynthesis
MARKINFLQIITNLELGGAQKNALYIIANLDTDRYNKHLICAPGGLLSKEASEILGLNLRFLPILRRNISPLKDLITLFFLVYYIKDKKIDIVHTHSSKAGILGRWAGRLAGVPIIIHTIHGWSFNKYLTGLIRRLYIFLERLTARITDKLIAVSESDIEKGLNNRIGNKEKYSLIRYGLNLNSPKNKNNLEITQKKKELGLNVSSHLIGMIACFKHQKNPLDFVRVASMVGKERPQTRFISVGDGLLREKIESLIEKEKLEKRVILLGWRKDVDKIMPMFDIVVLTSLWEGLPMVLLEAMACEKPIVAYDVDGIREIVKDGVNGYLVEAGDIKELSRKITLLLANKSLSQSMGKRGREILNSPSFNAAQMIAETDKIYTTLAKRKGKK